MATVTLKPISDLFDLTFWIPSYQRGYRWTKTQVGELLEDLYDFAAKKNDDEDYYCLQPVIVKKNGANWELVDGQQRLTAMWLVSAFYYCSNRDDVVGLKRKQYTLVYQEKDLFTNAFDRINTFVEKGTMRQAGEAFADLKRECIDSKFLVESIEQIVSFEYDHKTAKGVLGKIFEVIDHIKVIWYVLDEGEDPIETFTNINANKIELTNAELIKAVLLHSNSNENVVQNMAQQWESFEKKLNDDNFWSFIVNTRKKKYITRIDYLFEIWCAKHGYETDGSRDKHVIFRIVNCNIVNAEDGESFWHEIQEIFETLIDWYDDYYYYHTIGLLVILYSGNRDADIINKLYNKYSSSDKVIFKKYLISEIKKHFFGESKKTPFSNFNQDDITNELSDVTFGNSENVRNTLLLYNIAMLVNANNTYERFPFDLYKDETWDIEHINPQTPKEASDVEKKQWLSSYKKLLESANSSKELIRKIQACMTNGMSDFVEVSMEVSEYLDITDNNSITNLVLLDASTNRGYKNACFAEKRKKIIEVERNKNNDEKYIPIGTKWVFLKGFENADQLVVWSATDMNDYGNDITENIFKMLVGE